MIPRRPRSGEANRAASPHRASIDRDQRTPARSQSTTSASRAPWRGDRAGASDPQRVTRLQPRPSDLDGARRHVEPRTSAPRPTRARPPVPGAGARRRSARPGRWSPRPRLDRRPEAADPSVIRTSTDRSRYRAPRPLPRGRTHIWSRWQGSSLEALNSAYEAAPRAHDLEVARRGGTAPFPMESSCRSCPDSTQVTISMLSCGCAPKPRPGAMTSWLRTRSGRSASRQGRSSRRTRRCGRPSASRGRVAAFGRATDREGLGGAREGLLGPSRGPGKRAATLRSSGASTEPAVANPLLP